MTIKMTDEEIIIRKKFLNDAKKSYIEKGTGGVVPNSSAHSLDKDELFFIGLGNRKRVMLKHIAKALDFPELQSEEFFECLVDEFGPLKSNREIRAEKKEEQKRKSEEILKEISNPKYADFIKGYFGSPSNIVKNKKKIKVMEPFFEKPKDDILLSTLSLKILNDTHGMDGGTSYRNFLEKMIVYLYGENADLSDHNIFVNFSTINVYTNNIIVGNDNKWRVLCPPNIEELDFISNENIYIFENIGVYEEIGRQNPDIPIICSAGHYNSATRSLIEVLLNNNNNIYYSGDLDLAGLKIADNLLNEFPKVKLFNMNIDTYHKYKKSAIKSPKFQPYSPLINTELSKVQDLILNSEKVINQEVIEYNFAEKA